ncbi:CAP domain-containing protein [Flavobacterium agri]|nr:CAP domain-containing protein [Flavobacterium agri]
MMKIRFLGLVLFCAVAVSCSADSEIATPSSSNPDPSNIEDTTSYSYDADELEMSQLINNHRESIGLSSLTLVNYISLASEGHNTYMIENNVVNHDQFQQRAQDLAETLGAQNVSENVAYNYQYAQGAFDAWMRSSGHKAAIEGNFTHFGISVSEDPSTGKKYYTAMFAKID